MQLPPSASGLTTVVFIATVAVVAVLFVRAMLAVPASAASRTRRVVETAVLLAICLVPAAVLSRSGALDRYAPLPAPALMLVAAVTIVTVITAFSSIGLRLATGIGMAGLIGYQAFRIPVEWVLHRLFTEGVIPEQMTYAGRNFDIVTGATAVILAILVARRRAPRGLIHGWNVLGLLLLVNIVTIAVLSTPVPFRYFMNEPVNTLPSTFPFVWLPTFLVQAALFGHLLVFRALRRTRAEGAPPA